MSERRLLGRFSPQHRKDPEQDARTRIQGAVGGGPAAGRPKPQGRLRPGIVIGRMILNGCKALFVMLCAGLIVGSVVAVQMVQYMVEATANDENLLDLETRSMNETSYFMALNPANPNAKAENDYIEYQQLVGVENRTWMPYASFPQDLINAVVATEDKEFWVHGGVNYRRTAAALVNEVIPIQGMTGGASTITQQVVKNLMDDGVVEGEDGRIDGYRRKVREIFRAWGLEARYSKQMIMESYLNTIGLSGRLAGVEAGAQSYFDKTVSELTLAECATIAGITQAPTRYSPFQNPQNCLERRNRVIGYMLADGYITQAQADEVLALPTLGLAERRQTASNSTGVAGVFSYAVDKTYNDVLDDLAEQKGWTYATARSYLYNGGLRIFMTVDLNVQQSLDGIMVTGNDEGGFFMDEERFPNYRERMTVTEEITNAADQTVGYDTVLPQAAVAVVNFEGELIATSGGIGEKRSSLSLNRSIGTLQRDGDGNYVLDANGIPLVEGTLRQVGSTMKPIAAYALGIDYGIISYSKMVLDGPVQPRDPYNPQRNPETGAIIKDWPQNVSRTYRQTKIPVAAAITESTNTVAAQVGMWVGRERMFEFLRDKLQVTSLVEPDDIDLGPLVLGSQTHGISPYEMAGAYAMFGGDGTYGKFTSLHSYVRVEDSRGNLVMQPEITTIQAISPESGYVMNRMLANVVGDSSVQGASPTARGMRPEGEMPAVGKTGTTSDQRDRWFIGVTPYYVTAVWWGYDANHTLERWTTSPRNHIGANVWKTLMEQVQAGLPVKEFAPMPEGVTEQAYCTISGNLAGPGCPRATGYYTSGGLPEVCNGNHPPPAPEAPVV